MMHLLKSLIILLICCPSRLALASPASGAGECLPDWTATFGCDPTFSGTLHCVEIFDDGSGPALFAGGQFQIAGGVEAANIARWSGATWEPVAGGTNGPVWDMTVFDDGTGPALYVVGDFNMAGGVSTSSVARWDGSSWSPVGSGLWGVRTIAPIDLGTGPSLYVGGEFSVASGSPANRIARWDGVTWAALGTGLNGTAQSLCAWSGPTGTTPGLYVGGVFTTAGGQPASRIARWDGAAWAPLGSGLSGGVNVSSVAALTVAGEGRNSSLVAGGNFTLAGGVDAANIAQWNGRDWSTLSTGTNGPVFSLAWFKGTGAPSLYAGGFFSTVGGTQASGVAAWNGEVWSSLEDPNALGLVQHMTVGTFEGVETLVCSGSRIWTWSGTRATRLSTGLAKGSIVSLASAEMNDNVRLFAFGELGLATGFTSVAEWTGSAWQQLEGAPIGDAYAMTAGSVDGATALYVGGQFQLASDPSIKNFARWDGSSWSGLDAGLVGSVQALIIGETGAGTHLFVGGSFQDVGASGARNVAQWDGSMWQSLGGRGSGPDGPVTCMAIYDDGSSQGAALYVGGWFGSVNGEPAHHIARWNGGSWSALGSGVEEGLDGPPTSMCVFDDGSGPRLVVAGSFGVAGGRAASGLATWDGATWAPLGGELLGAVLVVSAGHDGCGESLYAGGILYEAGGKPISNIARWTPDGWEGLGDGLAGANMAGYDEAVWTLLSIDAPSLGLRGLMAGGTFGTSPGGDSYVAIWKASASTCLADLDADGSVGLSDLAIVLAGWGAADADLDGDRTTGASDLAVLLGAWGTCP